MRWLVDQPQMTVRPC